jgi:hypothetical protein
LWVFRLLAVRYDRSVTTSTTVVFLAFSLMCAR